MKKQSGIYEILNTVNGKRYIGSATRFNKRFAAHRCYLRQGGHHSPKLQRAWDKYSEKAFVFRPLIICTPAMLTFYEERAMQGFSPEYNIAIAAGNAMRGRHHSPETRDKIRIASTGRTVSAATRLLIGAAGKGRKPSAENLAKRSAFMKGNKHALGSKGRLGIPHSPESRAAMSLAHAGKPWTEKQRAAREARKWI